MGILRVYLALCVITAHGGSVLPWRMHDGKQAVQVFYLISGFYMAMVLSSRYATPRDFYVSRSMRIFPPYWIVLVGTVLLCATTGLLFDQWFLLSPYVTHPLDRNGAAGLWLTGFSNLTLIGQDWVMFLSHDFGHPLHFTDNFYHDASPLWRYLLVPQCWSVGVELTFYALAPYLNRLRSRWLVFIALAALAARLFAYWRMGLAHDPWDYRFFPFEMSLFLFGMLGYRLYKRTTVPQPSQRFRCNSKCSYLLGAFILLLLLYVHARAVGILSRIMGPEIGVLVTYPFWALGIPVLFFAFENQKSDRIIGELSYPIYLLQNIVIAVLTVLLTRLEFERWIGVASALVSVMLAGVLYHVFIVPMDRKRHNLTGIQVQ